MAKLIPGRVEMNTMFTIIGTKETYTYDDARKLHKNQLKKADYLARMDNPDGYTPDRMLEIFRERVRYVIERGATLNNPHISYGYFETWETISEDHAARLRSLVKNWLASAQLQSILQSDKP